jgi:hypothetical protein
VPAWPMPIFPQALKKSGNAPPVRPCTSRNSCHGGRTVEGEGWIVAIHDRRPEGHACLLIFDAKNIGAGPVATIRLPVRVRCTFHGMWVSKDLMAAE